MARFAKPFWGVPAGEIYPIEYQTGEDCPPELEAAAADVGALEANEHPEGEGEQPKGKAKK